MFLGNSGKAYSKETREQEFIRYFRDTGAAKAFQNGMITLFKMPIKPTNVTEYFAEYLGNGAQQLIRLSLLKAELCYKHSETQDMHKRIQNLENQIRSLKPTEKLSDEETSNIFSDYHRSFDTNNKTYDPMERFLEDLEDAPRGSAITTAAPSIVTNVQEDSPEEQEENSSIDTGSSYDEQDMVAEFEESPEVQCIREEDSTLAFRNDIKNLDPWGIVCNFIPARAETQKATKKVQDDSKKISGNKINPSVEMSSQESEGSSEPGRIYKNYDSDDAETLAEIYQTLAMDANKGVSQNQTGSIQDESEVKLLTVQKAQRLSMADLLGWSNVSRGNPMPRSQQFKKEDPNEAKYPRHWSEFIGSRGDQDSESDITTSPENPMGGDIYEEQASTNDLTMKDMDDSYLLEEDMQRISQKMQRAWSDESCLFDFVSGLNSEVTEACAESCRHSALRSSKLLGKKNKKEQGTMTIDDEKCCPCGEDCDCDCGLRPAERYRGSIPGKMTNWTKEDYDCYPGEDYELLGEDENVKCFKKKKTDDNKKSSLEQTLMKDIARARSPDYKCPCGEPSPLMSMSDCIQACGRQSSSISTLQNYRRGSKDEETMTLTEKQMKKQEEMFKKDSGDPEDLAQVFKNRQPYPTPDLPTEAKGQRTSNTRKKLTVDDGDKLPYLSDAYQLDLDKEVKRKFGF